MKRREVKEANITREVAYECLAPVEITGHKFLGRIAEGLVYENEEGLALVVKVITKSPDFEAEMEVEDFEEKQEAKKKAEAEKKAKGAKDKAKKEKAKKEEKGE